MSEAEVLRLRRLIEMAYLHAWGQEGSAEARDEWKALCLAWRPAAGAVTYHGGGRFAWEAAG